MNIESPQWEQYETLFRRLADTATVVKVPKPALDQCRYFLCLYGENGMPEADEFEMLAHIEQQDPSGRYRLEVDTDYWQDTVLFVP
jgi:hypothetical protein